jgi:hypothetical protein
VYLLVGIAEASQEIQCETQHAGSGLKTPQKHSQCLHISNHHIRQPFISWESPAQPIKYPFLGQYSRDHPSNFNFAGIDEEIPYRLSASRNVNTNFNIKMLLLNF